MFFLPTQRIMKFLSFKIYSFLVLSSTCYVPLRCNVQAVIRVPLNKYIPAVIFFGDSNVDTGNNNGLKTIVEANFLPYGQDFMGGKPTGRFNNGKAPPDLLVEELGIKELLSAYLDPNLQVEDLITGVNFASGRAGYDPLTSEILKVVSLSGQLEMFKEYIIKLKEIVGEDRKNEILANSLFILVIGSNDITNTYFSSITLQLNLNSCELDVCHQKEH
ncbi:GDSL esterase/lipase EXL3-like [Nicotiana tabacum]|uniref:GDSL esterase/lipase EXL3-like n=1 Tax=Nicotiana tabacum TaxID=4097 RepID=A0AC58SB00_TOBAC